MTPPPALRWRVARDAPSLGLLAGDVLRWDGTRPRGHRVVLERDLALHEGHLDRHAVIGTLGPLDGRSLSECRAVLVAQLVADQRARDTLVAVVAA